MKKMAALLAMAILASGVPSCRKRAESSDRPARIAGIPRLARFRPPADGQLTEAQIDSYIRVRRAAKGRTDLEAAQAVAVDPGEYSWVRARVIEALVALEAHKVRTGSEETYSKTIAALRKARQSARDQETQKTLDEQIAGLERERSSLRQMEALPGEVAANAKRVAPRRAEIEALPP
jgi:hypothetical protein